MAQISCQLAGDKIKKALTWLLLFGIISVVKKISTSITTLN
jgi:hypothetical protein